MNSLYGDFRNYRFDYLYPDVETFINGDEDREILGWNSCPYKIDELKQSDIEMIYYLLYANYGNSSIASNDKNRFEFKMFSLIFQHAPIWARKMEIQKRLRSLNEEEIREGTKAILNSALNPSTVPSTDGLTELNYIDSQKTTSYKKSKTEAYTELWGLITTDVTQEFINRFKDLFLKVVYPENILLYEDLENEGNNY